MKKLITTLLLITISITLNAQVFKSRESSLLELLLEYKEHCDTTLINPIILDTIYWNGYPTIMQTESIFKLSKTPTLEDFIEWLNKREMDKTLDIESDSIIIHESGYYQFEFDY